MASSTWKPPRLGRRGTGAWNLAVHRHLKAGAVHAHLLRRVVPL